MNICMVTVPALVDGDTLVIVSESGKHLSRLIRFDEVRECPDPVMFTHPEWLKAVARMRQRLENATQRLFADEWTRKAHTWAASLRRRRRDERRVKSRRRGEGYRSATWDQAARRLWTQAHNRFRHHQRTDWQRWSITVANNHNKREGGRYASSGYGDGN